MAVNYTVQYDSVSVNAGGIWGLQGTENGDTPLIMTISPDQGYIVSAVDFNIAGQSYSESSEISENLMSYTYYATDLTAGSLPTGVNKVTIEDTGYSGGNTVKVKAWVDASYSLPWNNTSLILDIDGDAQEQIIPDYQYTSITFQQDYISEEQQTVLQVNISNPDPNAPIPSVQLVIDESSTATSFDVLLSPWYNFGTSCVGSDNYFSQSAGVPLGSAPWDGTVNFAGVLGNDLSWMEGGYTISSGINVYACLDAFDDAMEGLETLTVKLAPFDSNGVYTGEPQATLTIGPAIAPTVTGCTDSNAINYNPLANSDNGTCVYAGCMDPSADNYNPNATEDNGTCIYNSTNITIEVEIQENAEATIIMPNANTGSSEYLPASQVGQQSTNSASVILTIPAQIGDANFVSLFNQALLSMGPFIIVPNDGHSLSRHNLRFEQGSQASTDAQLNQVCPDGVGQSVVSYVNGIIHTGFQIAGLETFGADPSWTDEVDVPFSGGGSGAIHLNNKFYLYDSDGEELAELTNPVSYDVNTSPSCSYHTTGSNAHSQLNDSLEMAPTGPLPNTMVGNGGTFTNVLGSQGYTNMADFSDIYFTGTGTGVIINPWINPNDFIGNNVLVTLQDMLISGAVLEEPSWVEDTWGWTGSAAGSALDVNAYPTLSKIKIIILGKAMLVNTLGQGGVDFNIQIDE